LHAGVGNTFASSPRCACCVHLDEKSGRVKMKAEISLVIT